MRWTILAGCAAALAAGTTLTMLACSSKSVPPPPPAVGGGSCATDPGKFPAPNCDYATGYDQTQCKASDPACPTAPCTGSSACLAMADNGTGKTLDFRMRKLNVVAPAVLVGPPTPSFIQKGVIDQGINLKNQCGEGGDGAFNWLARFDMGAGTFTTGGAPPSADPFGAGYCFTKMTVNGLSATPITAKVTQDASDGTWSSDVIDKLNVPIFVHGSLTSIVILPISKARVQNVTISKDNNCIGSYDPTAVAPKPDNTCFDSDPSTCERWHTAGSLGGYITLDESDRVDVVDLSETLCGLLTQGKSIVTESDNFKHCTKDTNGHVTGVQGDFCSTTDSPGGCMDSFWLAATFAASAVKIGDGSGVAQCNGTMLTDGGVADSGHD